MKELPYLNGLRGAAILMVFLIHSGGFGLRSLGHLGNSIVDHGKYGVTVFFVASAYVLTAQMSEKPVSWPAFYLRRLFRIAPMYFLVLGVALVTQPLENWPSAASIWAHFSFANVVMPQYANDILSVEWSIAVEMAFYALFPLVMAVQKRGVAVVAILTTVAALPSVRHLVYEWIGGDFFTYRHYTLPWHLYAFLAGIVAFKAQDIAARVPVLPAIFVMVGAMLIWGEGPWSGPVVAIATALIIFDAHNGGASSKALSCKPLTFIGKISFSVYLTHMLLITWLGPLLALPASLALSFATWTYVEEPARHLAKRIRL